MYCACSWSQDLKYGIGIFHSQCPLPAGFFTVISDHSNQVGSCAKGLVFWSSFACFFHCRLEEDPDGKVDVVSFTSAIGAVDWPRALELMISMEARGLGHEQSNPSFHYTDDMFTICARIHVSSARYQGECGGLQLHDSQLR